MELTAPVFHKALSGVRCEKESRGDKEEREGESERERKRERGHGGEGIRSSDVDGHGARASVLGGDGGRVRVGAHRLLDRRAQVPSPRRQKRKSLPLGSSSLCLSLALLMCRLV